MALEIVNVETVKGDLGEQVKFEDRSGDILFVPSASVTRQLDRCGVGEIDDLRGKTIYFSRSASLGKNGKPYWNLDKAKPDDPRHTNGKPPVANGQKLLPNESGDEGYLDAVVAQESAPAKSDGGFDVVLAKYGECFTEALGFATRAQKAGIPVDLSGVSAVSSTLFIERNRARV